MTLSRRLIASAQINEVDFNGGPAEEPTSETVLWRSVLLQALQDGTQVGALTQETSVERVRAIAWVCASIGVTAQDFEEVCHLAKVDPDLFQEEFNKFIQAGTRFVLRRDSPKEEIQWITTEPSGSEPSSREL